MVPTLLTDLPRPEDGRVRRAEPADRDAVRDCYARVASRVNGWLDRPEFWWQIREIGGPWRSSYLAEGEGGRIDGYLVYDQREPPLPGLPFTLVVEDFIWETRDAALGLWGLLAS